MQICWVIYRRAGPVQVMHTRESHLPDPGTIVRLGSANYSTVGSIAPLEGQAVVVVTEAEAPLIEEFLSKLKCRILDRNA